MARPGHKSGAIGTELKTLTALEISALVCPAVGILGAHGRPLALSGHSGHSQSVPATKTAGRDSRVGNRLLP